jgi:signal-transduction protein with cAMP-binding, CBS, and nucleotidyltransferase domain
MERLMSSRIVGLDHRQLFPGISTHQPFDASKASLHGCNQQAVKNSIRGPIRYSRDAMIVCEGDPTEYIFLVVSGVVRSCRIYQDGSRRIVAFHFPGEFFGWSDLIHSLSAEAATDTQVLFSNVALCLPFETAELQVICWPQQQKRFDAYKSIHCC